MRSVKHLCTPGELEYFSESASGFHFTHDTRGVSGVHAYVSLVLLITHDMCVCVRAGYSRLVGLGVEQVDKV